MDKRQEKLTDRCLTLLRDPRFWVFVVWTAFLISLVPLLYLSQYSHSCADDYSYGLLTHLAWEESHSLFAVLQAACQKVWQNYMTWQGSFAAMFLFTLQPAIFGEEYYWVCSWILSCALIFSTVYLCRVFFGRLLGKKALGDLFAGLLLLIQFQLMPSPLQGLYWWNGASYYVIFYCLLLVQLGEFLVLLSGGASKLRTALCCLLGLLLGGGNYVTALLAFEMCLLFLLLAFLLRRSRGNLLLACAVTIASFLISVAAPGNAVRQSFFVHSSALGAIRSSYHLALVNARAWTRAPLLMASLFMAPFFWQLCREKLPKGLKPLPAAALLFLLFSTFASSFTPTEYAMPGYEIPGRILNVCFFLWCVLFFLAEAVGIAAVQYLLSGVKRKELPLLRWGMPALLASMVLCAGVYTGHHWHAGEYDYLSATLALRALQDGSAAQFDAETDIRVALLRSGEGSVELAPYSVRPSILLFDDIQEDPTAWRNRIVAQFYGLDQVTLGPSP